MMNPIAVSAIKSIIPNIKKIIDQGKSINILENKYNIILFRSCAESLLSWINAFICTSIRKYLSHGLSCAIFLVPVIEFNSTKTDIYDTLIEN